VRDEIYARNRPRDARVFPYSVKHGIHALPARDLVHTLERALRLVDDHIIRARLARKRSFLRGARRPDDGRTACLDKLCEEQAEPACDRVNEYGVSRVDCICFGQKVTAVMPLA
jgi:hypothetical protein